MVFRALSIFSVFFWILIPGLPRTCTKFVETGRNLWNSFFYTLNLGPYIFLGAFLPSASSRVCRPPEDHPGARSGSGFRADRRCLPAGRWCLADGVCRPRVSGGRRRVSAATFRQGWRGRGGVAQVSGPAEDVCQPGVSASFLPDHGLAYQQPPASGSSTFSANLREFGWPLLWVLSKNYSSTTCDCEREMGMLDNCCCRFSICSLASADDGGIDIFPARPANSDLR